MGVSVHSEETRAQPRQNYRALAELPALDRYETVAIVVDLDPPDEFDGRLVGVSFCGEPASAFWLPALSLDAPKLTDLSKGKRLVFHNAKYALTALERHGVSLADAEIVDTMIVAHLLDENGSKELRNLSRRYLGEVMHEGGGTPQLSLFAAATEIRNESCAEADIVFRLYETLMPLLEKTPTLTRLYYEYELPTMRVIRAIERTGIRLDIPYFKRLGDEFRLRIRVLEERIFEETGRKFLITSNVELAEVLYDELGLPPRRETYGGHRSVDGGTLEGLRTEHPVIPLLEEHRELTKLLTTYVDKLPQMVRQRTGRLHCHLNQVGTITGRFSSHDPNLQSIPRDKTIRTGFIAEDGYLLVDADFSQIELRCVAHYARDPKMMEAFQNDVDLHKKTIADILGKPIESVTPQERALAKAINFGLVYGMGAPRLARATGITRQEAEAFIKAYFDTYGGVRRFRDEVRAYADKHLQVISIFGRRRRYRDKDDARPALNALIQGTAADVCRVKMLALDAALPSDARMLLQVHDEILFEIPESKVESTLALIIEAMESPFEDLLGRPFRVPIRVEAGVGRNWGETK